mgnify:CR=1 FL=1
MISERLNSFNKLSFFLFFFLIIFISRAIFLELSLSKYPWFYEWQHLDYFLKIKDGDYSFLFSHALRNQFQIFTKLIYIVFFNLSDFNWFSKIWTIIIQIIPSLTLSIIITSLFYGKIKSNWIYFLLIIFSIFPASISNFYHISESHFYFQLLISILAFYVYGKFNGFKCFSLIIPLCIFSIFNMAAVSVILFLTFSVFFFVKFLFERNKVDFFNGLIVLILTMIYYFVCYNLKISSIYETSNIADSSIRRSLYLVFKGFFHQNNIILGVFLLITFSFCLFKNDRILINKLRNNYFLMLLIFYSFLVIISISAGKVQIYDRYKDFFQIFGYITLFLFLNLSFKKYINYFLRTLITVIVLYNSIFFFDKFLEMRSLTYDYDLSIDKAIKDYNDKAVLISEKNLHPKATRFPLLIMTATDNKLFLKN